MRKLLLLLVLAGCAVDGDASPSAAPRAVPLSAFRDPDTDWRALAPTRTRAWGETAQWNAEAGHRTVIAPPSWTQAELDEGFAFMRDGAFLVGERRLPWLYPLDGCYLRATRAIHELGRGGWSTPATVYAFGNLSVATRFAPGGGVTWWYHVAPVVIVDGAEYVLDPALDGSAPLLRADWETRIGSEVSTTCSPHTQSPDSDCEDPGEPDVWTYLDDSPWSYLNLEWQNLDALGLRPAPLLSDRPPWVAPGQGMPCGGDASCPAHPVLAAQCTLDARTDGLPGCGY